MSMYKGQTKPINTVCGRNSELLYFKVDGTHSYHCHLRGQRMFLLFRATVHTLGCRLFASQPGISLPCNCASFSCAFVLKSFNGK